MYSCQNVHECHPLLHSLHSFTSFTSFTSASSGRLSSIFYDEISIDWAIPPPFGKNVQKSPVFMITSFWNRWDPPPFWEKIQKIAFFQIWKFPIGRDPPTPHSEFFQKIAYFFCSPYSTSWDFCAVRYDDHHMILWQSSYGDIMTLTCCQYLIITENIWFAWY